VKLIDPQAEMPFAEFARIVEIHLTQRRQSIE
jgi:hypothetical protein